MKKFVIEFSDEELEDLSSQLEKAQDAGVLETMEEYIHYATITHCRTMKAAASLCGQPGGLEELLGGENIHVGVVNMPVQLNDIGDKDEFSEYLSDVLNDAVRDFNNRNNGRLN